MSCRASRARWYAYTATTDGLIHADTFGSNYDTVLSVYTFPEQSTFELVTCNDDFPESSLQSSVDFQAVDGETSSSPAAPD